MGCGPRWPEVGRRPASCPTAVPPVGSELKARGEGLLVQKIHTIFLLLFFSPPISYVFILFFYSVNHLGKIIKFAIL